MVGVCGVVFGAGYVDTFSIHWFSWIPCKCLGFACRWLYLGVGLFAASWLLFVVLFWVVCVRFVFGVVVDLWIALFKL